MSGFANTTAVVTGASSGIGQAITIALAESGVERIVVHYRNNESGARETAAAVEKLGRQTHLVRADLAVDEDRQRLVEIAFDKLGAVQTWINNAGADVLTGDAAKLDFDAKLQRLIDVDVLGSIAVSRGVAKRWSECRFDRPPSMTLVGWDQAPRGMEGDAGQMFGTVKAAVMAFANSLAQSLAPEARVNTVAPGWIQTTWGHSASTTWSERATNQSLMRRWGAPADVAQAVLYLANPDHTFVTGQTVDVNGGWNRAPGSQP